MTAQEFKAIWSASDDNLNPLSLKRLTSFSLKPSTIEFLTEAGLPTDAAPFLTFVKNSSSKYNEIDRLTEVYDLLEDDFRKWIVIGSCGNGDPIAINIESNDEICWLNHEDNFTPSFFNSSIESLLKCLLAYREFILDIQKQNGESAVLDSNFSDAQFDVLRGKLLTVTIKSLLIVGFGRNSLKLTLRIVNTIRPNDCINNNQD